jgi:protein FAM50
MDSSNPSSAVPSRGSTPKLGASSRFTSQNATAEDLLKSQTIGLVQLSDFRKRRAEALEVKEREGLERSSGKVTPTSGASTPIDG